MTILANHVQEDPFVNPQQTYVKHLLFRKDWLVQVRISRDEIRQGLDLELENLKVWVTHQCLSLRVLKKWEDFLSLVLALHARLELDEFGVVDLSEANRTSIIENSEKTLVKLVYLNSIGHGDPLLEHNLLGLLEPVLLQRELYEVIACAKNGDFTSFLAGCERDDPVR